MQDVLKSLKNVNNQLRDCLVWLQFASENGFEFTEVGKTWKGT